MLGCGQWLMTASAAAEPAPEPRARPAGPRYTRFEGRAAPGHARSLGGA
jgi:hypothetical protein